MITEHLYGIIKTSTQTFYRWTMVKQEIETVRELIYFSYANLAMAHTAVDKRLEKYEPFNFMIRAKLFKGLKEGKMNIRTIFDDEKIKLQTGQICNYCGSKDNLALDHIFPQKLGGQDYTENLIFACRTCNISKGKYFNIASQQLF